MLEASGAPWSSTMHPSFGSGRVTTTAKLQGLLAAQHVVVDELNKFLSSSSSYMHLFYFLSIRVYGMLTFNSA